MNNEYTPSMREELANGRASFCDFLAAPLLTIPDAAYVNQICSPEFRQALATLAQDEDIHPQISRGAALMRAFLDENAGAAAETLLQTLGVERTRLMRGLSPSYGPPPPYENQWVRGAGAPMELLRQLSGIYLEDGLELDGATPERQDYLGVELAYLARLARREAAALQDGDETQASAALERQVSFFGKHLQPWAPGYAFKALEFARTDFYQGYLLMLVGFILDQAEIFAELQSGE